MADRHGRPRDRDRLLPLGLDRELLRRAGEASWPGAGGSRRAGGIGAERALEDRQGVGRVDIAGQEHRHVVGHVPTPEEADHVAEGRRAQVLERAERGLCPVGVAGEQPGQERLEHALLRIVERAVLLLVDRLQLGQEQRKRAFWNRSLSIAAHCSILLAGTLACSGHVLSVNAFTSVIRAPR